MKKSLFMAILFVIVVTSLSDGKEVPFTQEDRDRLRSVELKLERIEATLKEFKESVDKRFEQVDKRFEQMMTFIWILAGIFTGMTGVTIGFAIWDRRTMVRPFEIKIKGVEEEIAGDRKKLHNLIEAFRNLARTDEKVADILRQLNLL